MIKSLRKFLISLPPWFLTGITLIAILWLTLSPKPFGELTPPLFPGADKLAHAMMFGFLVIMAAVDYSRKKTADKSDKLLSRPVSPLFLFSCALLSSLLGVAIEYLQKWLETGRAFEYTDMIADSCGAFAAAIILLILKPKMSDSL